MVTYLVSLLVTAYLWVVVNSYRFQLDRYLVLLGLAFCYRKELTSGPREQDMNYMQF